MLQLFMFKDELCVWRLLELRDHDLASGAS